MTTHPVEPASIDVLVIDDDAVIRTMVQAYLTKAGFAVRVAPSGATGLQFFAQSPAGVVLVDVRMPEMNGYEVCERLRASPEGQYVPVLMMTGTESLESVELAFEAGATDFATKPLNLSLLVHRLRYMLRTSSTAEQLREREQSLLDAQRIAGLGSWKFFPGSGRFTFSDVLIERLELQSAGLTMREFLHHVHPKDRQRVDHDLRHLGAPSSNEAIEFRWHTSMGSELFLNMEAYGQPANAPNGQQHGGMIQDITERRHAESQIRKLAFYDSTTNLANRALLQENLPRLIATAQREEQLLAVLLIDLDHFKRINDTWGHQTGDHALTIIAQRLTECLRKVDLIVRGGLEPVLGRMGGDEFVILLPGLTKPEDAALVAQRINENLSEPLCLHETSLVVGSSIGISICPDNAADAQTLLRQADAAMYDAKQHGRDCFRFFTPEIQARAFSRLTMEVRIREALENEEFLLHFQPKISLSDGITRSVEALVRWADPKLGLISPGEFIPIAEDSGLILPLGQWVLESACAQIKLLQESLGQNIGVSVNLSALQLQQPDLVESIQATLSKTGLAAESLELELTESLLMRGGEAPVELLDRLKALGIQLSIDDFGTGYSSLSYLKRFPIDTLKIDQSFIRDIEQDADDAAIVDAAITLAHKLRLKVVAEGVETESQEFHLRRLDCDEVQGYHYSRPLPMERLTEWLNNNKPKVINKSSKEIAAK